MLHVALLFLLGVAADEPPVLKGELKSFPATEKSAPSFRLEGETDLPTGALLDITIHYGTAENRKLISEVATVRDGKILQVLQPFPKRKDNFPGKYVAVIRFNPGLQNKVIPGMSNGRVEIPAEFGTAESLQQETAAVRAQLAAEVKAVAAFGDEVRAQMQKLKGQPASAWSVLLQEWVAKSNEIQRRSDPRNVPEYTVLQLDPIAMSGLETLSGILLSAARTAAAGRNDEAVEGLTRLSQTAVFWTSEISAPRLSTPGQILAVVEEARALAREALSKPDQPVLPFRRKFTELNALIQRSLPDQYQAFPVEIGTRAIAFFTALADKDANVKDLHAELDKALEKLAVPLRTIK